MNKKRYCPLCEKYKPNVLKTLEFAQVENEILPSKYRVVSCRNCGFVYDDVEVGPDIFLRHYAVSEKYVQRGIGGSGDISIVDSKRYNGIFNFVRWALKCTEIGIADVGCGKGGLLRFLKKRGYSNVFGFDPSPSCVDIISKEYGIPAVCAGITDIARYKRRFGLVFVSNVFEHLFTVHDAVEAIDAILEDDGFVYVDVPDGSRYYQWFYAPYYSFDKEHINHFNVSAMTSLWAQHGYECIRAEELVGTPVSGRHIPMCRFLFQRLHAKRHRRDCIIGLSEGIHKFIEQSEVAEAKLALQRIPANSYYWGCGAYAKWLLNRFSEGTLGNPVAIVDAGTNGKSSITNRAGAEFPLIMPSLFEEHVDKTQTMVITSVLYERQIFANLRENGWLGPVYSGASGRRKRWL
jgi:SAM-dependent methyltransferase